MHYQFRIVAEQNGYRVFAKTAPSREEKLNQVQHLHEMGWGLKDIVNELRVTEETEDDVSGGHAHDYGISADYVLTVMKPGDIIISPWGKFLVQKRGRA